MKALVNILGTGRSGTTMLDLMIGNSPNAFSCGEVHAWFRPWRTHHFKIDCSCGADPCYIWEKLKNVREETFHKTIFSEMEVDLVVDSSKNLCWLIDTYSWLPPDTRVLNLVIYKDPIDIVYSYYKRWPDTNRVLHLLSSRYIYYYKALIGLNIPLMSVRYKELVENPGNKLHKICQKLGVPYFEGKENFFLNTHHFLFGSYGVRKQVRNKNSFIYKREPWPEDFQRKVKYFENEFRSSPALKTVLETLERCEVENLGKAGEMRPHSIRKPFWYYRQRLALQFRKYFPEKFETKTFRQADYSKNINRDSF